MISNNFSKYRKLLNNKSFRNFWMGFALSNIGDAMTRVALNWYVWETTHSAKALGLLTFLYFGPVIFGGLLAGWLLDRFDKRLVLQIDSLVRGTAVAIVPLLFILGELLLWHVYLVAAIYGILMMISLAGSPSVVPSLVEEEDLPTANAFESFAFTFSNIVGPAIAGLLIAKIGAPNVVAFDALTYFFFAAILTRVSLPAAEPDESSKTSQTRVKLSQATNLLTQNKILLSTTFMFMFANIGGGLLMVWLPMYADEVLAGGAGLYGSLLGIVSLGEVLSTILVGGWVFSLSLGSLIAIFQLVSGIMLMLMFSTDSLIVAGALLFAYGISHAPLTIWAQTLRMKIIPENLRGRTFALLRMIMMSGNPLGGALAGALTLSLGIPGLIIFSGLFYSIPGVLGLSVKELRRSDKFIELSADIIS